MNTPIYDTLKAEQYEWAPTDPRYYAKVTGEFPRDTVIARITQKPEPTWKTFLRCMGWWKP